MENASDALIMAFGVLVFVIALTVAITSFSQAREVSELVIYNADSTNFYEYEEVLAGASQSRIVGIETIIPTLYRYSKENYTVLFRIGSHYNQDTGNFDGGIKVMEIFKSPVNFNGITRRWRVKDNDKKLYWEKLQAKYKRFVTGNDFDSNSPGESTIHSIFSFDSEEEQMRNEPWTLTPEETKKNLDCFIRGEIYKSPVDGKDYIDYSKENGGNFIAKYSNKSFVENIAEIEYKKFIVDTDTDDKIVVDTSKTSKGKKRIYIFTLINN